MPQTSTTISVRIDARTKKQLEALAGRARTQYVIPYRVGPERLEIIAVFHGRQQWPARL